jgi:formate hydrogenlyase subunit 4
MNAPETLLAVAAAGLQVAVVVVGAPYLTGLMRQVRARVEGRAGAGVGQPVRDLRKLFHKEATRPEGTSVVFVAAPLIMLASAVFLAAVIPFVSTVAAVGGVSDLFAVVAILLLGTVALTLAGLDTGTAFGGIGASREVTIVALVEPTILLAIFALSVRVGSSDLTDIVAGTLASPAQVLSPASLLAAVAFAVVIIAEAGRLPVDNPSTHLELTMVHEAMVLEYSGRDLAMVELAASMRLTLLLGLGVNLFAPWGVATTLAPLALLLGVVMLVAKVALAGVALAVFEVFMAKLRLFRVPELLAGSLLFALLAVAASYFLA